MRAPTSHWENGKRTYGPKRMSKMIPQFTELGTYEYCREDPTDDNYHVYVGNDGKSLRHKEDPLIKQCDRYFDEAIDDVTENDIGEDYLSQQLVISSCNKLAHLCTLLDRMLIKALVVTLFAF